MRRFLPFAALLGATLLISGCESSTAPDHIPTHAVAQLHAGGTLLNVFESPDLATPFGQIETIATAESGAEHYDYRGPSVGGAPSGLPAGVNLGRTNANVWVHEDTRTGEFTLGFIMGRFPDGTSNFGWRFDVRIVGSNTAPFFSEKDGVGEPADFFIETAPGVFSTGGQYGSNTDGFTISGITGFLWTVTVTPTNLGVITDWFAASGELTDFTDDVVLTLGEEYVITPGERIAVDIDIKPGSDPNSIYPKSMGDIPVAIFTTSTADGDAVDFDVQLIDPSTVRFGPGRTSPTHDSGDPLHEQDVDGDGDIDLVLHFNTKLSGISVGDTQACVFGTTVSEDFFGGCDDVRVLEEPEEPEEPDKPDKPVTRGAPFVLLATTNRGALVEIDVKTDGGTARLIGDAGVFEGRDLGWTGISFDPAGNLFVTSRQSSEFNENCPDFGGGCAHLYTIDPGTGAVLSEVGSTGVKWLSDIDFNPDGTLYGNRWLNLGTLLMIAPTTAAVTPIGPFGADPFGGPLQNGGVSVHPQTDVLWAVESSFTNSPSTIFKVDRATGVAFDIIRLGLGGGTITFGFDALEILPDGRFIGTRGGRGPEGSELYEIDPTPDPVSGLAELTLIPLVFDTGIQGSLNGLESRGPGRGP